MPSTKEFIFEVYCIFCVAGIPLSVRYGFGAWCLQTLLGYASVFIDWKLFPYAEKNLQTLEKHGYGRPLVATIMFINLVLTNALVALVYANIELKEITSVFSVLAAIKDAMPYLFINLALTEIFFTTAHTLLHCTKTGSKIHTMHHCCKHSSWSTNLVFHPIDMAAEFSGPVLSVLGMHLLFWKDDTVLALTVLIVHLWYALDHSALLQLPHTKHHKYIDSMYSIYIKRRSKTKAKEFVKHIINK